MKCTLDGNPSNGVSILLPPPTLCLHIAASFFFDSDFSAGFKAIFAAPNRGTCTTRGAHRIRSAIPKFLFAAQALTLLGHDEINRLIRFNQVNQIKGVRPRHEPKVGCQRSKRKVDHGIRRKDLLT